MGVLHNPNTEARVELGDAMRIRKLKVGFYAHEWDVSYTIKGDRKWHYTTIISLDEIKAYILAATIAQDHELKQVKSNLADLRLIQKRMPNPQTLADIAKAKKLLTDVNKTQVREKATIS